MEAFFNTKTMCFLLIFIICSCNETKLNHSDRLNFDLDAVKTVPDWLKMNVDEAIPSNDLAVWIPTDRFQSSSLIRVPRFPRKFSEEEIRDNNSLNGFKIMPLKIGRQLKLKAVRNEQVSAQMVMGAKQTLSNVRVELSALSNAGGEVIPREGIQIRYVKYVPVQRSRSEYTWSPKLETIVGEGVSGNLDPNVVGDPLVTADTINISAYRAQPVWFTIKVPENTIPGFYHGLVTIRCDEFEERTYKLRLEVLETDIPNPSAYEFHLDLWVNPSVIADYYGLEHWSEAHWGMISKYLRAYAAHGGKNVTTTITHQPWRKPWIGGSVRSQVAFGYKSMVLWSKTKTGDWDFDFSIFNKYVSTANKAGITRAIHAFSMTPFHSDQIIYYLDQADNEQKKLTLKVGDKAYREAWGAFLHHFKLNLIHQGWLEKTFLGFDEKPDSTMKTIHAIIKKAAPEFLDKIVIAGHPEVGETARNLSISYMFFPGQSLEKYAKVPVLSTIADRNEKGELTTFYLCAEPAHPNTLTYSPAVESQMIPWLALKYNTDGYLRWAFNNWTDNPIKKPVFIHSQGDDYYVYPGKDGPISSIRWELLKEGIEDYELYKTVEKQGHISRKDLKDAIELATRDQDGRYKNTNDLLEARELILNKKLLVKSD